MPITNMSHEDFAALERTQGAHIREVDGVYWRRVRPFFYRPLFQFQEFSPSAVRAPAAARLGCYQFAVPNGHAANSHLNLLMFEDAPKYSIASLDQNRKRQVRLGIKALTIREISDPAELKEGGHPAYLSFFERTRYEYKSDRRDKSVFARWVDDQFRFPGNIILGAYRGSELAAVGISQVVGDTLVYSTFFAGDIGLKHCAADLMLHTVREQAAALPCVRQIFAGMYKGGNGPDSSLVLRGCKIVRKPAILRVNPAAALFLRLCLPGRNAKLLGKFEELSNATEVASAREAVAG
ncbi:MAG: hypothetical protein WA871_05640 [Candidatus Acidiferrales bacterium]